MLVKPLKFWDSAPNHWVQGDRRFGIRRGPIFKGQMPNEELDTRTLRMVPKRCPGQQSSSNAVQYPRIKETSTAPLRKPKISHKVAVLVYLTDTYSSGVPRNFVRGRGGSTNSVEDRGQRERGSGGGGPLVRGSGGSCNLVQGISFHIVKVS